MKNCIFLQLLLSFLLSSSFANAQATLSSDQDSDTAKITTATPGQVIQISSNASSDSSLLSAASLDKRILKATKKNNLISLEWLNEAGDKVAKFEVERSSDGTNFKKIGEIVFKNIKPEVSYVFVDAHPLQINYYRLKIINSNSAFTYSKELVVRQNGPLAAAIQPNPFTQSFTVEAYLAYAQPIKIQLLDMSGRLLRYKSLAGKPGTNKIEFDDVGSLQRGIYMVRIVKGYSVIEKKIVKNN